MRFNQQQHHKKMVNYIRFDHPAQLCYETIMGCSDPVLTQPSFLSYQVNEKGFHLGSHQSGF